MWNPEDGHVDPTSVTQALVKGARDRGARYHQAHPGDGHRADPGGEWRVVTDQGEIRAEVVVNAAGTWAREVGQLAGLDLPIVPMEHQYLVTEAIPEIAALGRELPLLREVDASYYLRQEARDFSLGPYERGAKPFGVGGIPTRSALTSCRRTRAPPRASSIRDGSGTRARPGRRRADRQGPITYTPEETRCRARVGLPGFWLACGVSFGITQAGGIGQYLAEWIVGGQPSIDLWEVDPRRYGAYATERYAVARCIDTYEDEYAIVYPQDDRRAGPAGPDEPALRPLPRRRRGLRRPERLGAAVLVRAFRDGAARPAQLPAGPTGSTRSARRPGRSASGRGCWSCRASRSTRSTARARTPSSTGSARTGSRRSGGSRSPSSSPCAAQSSAT